MPTLVLPRHGHRLRPLFLLLSLLGVLCIAPARASADGQRVIVVSSADVPEELERGVSKALSDVCYVSDAREYLAAARSQRLSPTDDAALTRVGPKAHARMLVVLDYASKKLQVTYRDGKNGAVLEQQSLPARGRHPKLSARNGKKLLAVARGVLAKLSGQSAPPIAADSSSDDDDDDDDDSAVSAPAAPVKRAQVARAQPTPQPKAAAAAAASDEEESQDGEPEQAEEAPESGDKSSGGDLDISVRIRAGGGAGARILGVPTRLGPSGINTGFAFPAIALGIDVQVVFASGFILGGGIDYRGLFGAKAVQDIGSETHTSSVGSHSLSIGVTPGYRFGPKGSPDLRVFLGYHYRTLTPTDVELPGASTGGIALRPELRIPLAGDVLSLRLAPELLVVLTHDTRLPGNVAGLSQVGIGYGGEVSLDVRLSGSIMLGVEYRESHVSVASGWTTAFEDVERYATGRITLQL